MVPFKDFGERVAQERREKAARDRRDIGQKDVAEAVRTTPATVSRWEAGLNMPDDAVLSKLASYFGVTPAWLRYGVPETKTGAPRLEQRKALDPANLIVSRGKRRKGDG